jgi:hypothetical protein
VGATWRWPLEATGVVVEPHAPALVRVIAAVMACGSAGVALVEGLALFERSLPAPRPLHVRVRLRASLERVWNVTQDHRLHPRWDHRFSRIEMLFEAPSAWTSASALSSASASATTTGTADADENVHADANGQAKPDARIRTGTRMRYEKRMLGMTVRGCGCYKLHRPMRQSTFEFWSDDVRSLIRRGVGLWLYTPLGDGAVEMSTSYTYEVRWGLAGRIIDRVLFRPLFQRYTEASFRRLARGWFGDATPYVLGRDGRKPLRFAPAERARLVEAMA